MVTCYPSYEMTPPLPSPAQCGATTAGVGGQVQGAQGGKDYSRPLHVDCSVEYELPDAAKPPAGQRSEPLLMIHPCYYRRAEAQRRTRFVNNLPKSLSSPVSSSSSSSSSSASSGRRSKVARLASSAAVEPSWTQPKPVSVPVYPAPPGPPAGLASCYKVGATADFSTASWPGRTPAAPSSAKLDAGAVLSDIIASTCSELNNNYMKQQHHQPSQNTSSSGSSQTSTYPSYQPVYHPHHPHHPSHHHQHGTSLLDCKTCQFQPPQTHGLHHSSSTTSGSSSSSSSQQQPSLPPQQQQQQQQHQASQATQVNRLYGGGLVKADPVSTKVRRCGVKRSRSSRALQSVQERATPRATPSWSDAMLHLNATGFSFESAAASAAAAAAAGVWYPHQGTPQHQHHPHAPAPGATAADPLGAPLAPLGAWGAMFPHCREREDDSRVLWNSDSLLRLVPV